MKKSIKCISAMLMLISSASSNALEINGSSITDGATKVSSKPSLVFVFTSDIKSSEFILKDANNKVIGLRKTLQNNAVSLIPRRGLKESQKYTLSIQAKDSSEALTQTINFTVGKGDIKKPEITSASNITIDENEKYVLRISANDESKIIYALMKSRDGSKFNLDSNSGALTLKDKADYEKQRKYVTKVSATDSKGNQALQGIVVRVNDLNEVTPIIPGAENNNAPVFTSASNINLNENQKSVVVLKATGTRVRYSLGGRDALSFNLNSKNGNLKFKVSPKFSAKSSYSIIITATDKYKNSSTQAILISIKRDGDEGTADTKVPVFTSDSNIRVNENQTSVITVKATDENEVIYSLSGTDYSSFTLDSKSGMLSFKIAPDYETKTSYSIKVSAKDTAGNSSTQTIRVTIKDIDEQEENKFPTANAGTDKTVKVDSTITITGAGTDTDGSISKYEWKKGDTLLSSAASFDYTPNRVGTDILTLKVTDNDGATDSDKIKIVVTSLITDSCDVDTALVGGVFTDSDTTTSTIDELTIYDFPDNEDKNIKYSRNKYKQLLLEGTPLQGNLHNYAFTHYKEDFEAHRWPEVAHLLLRYIQANARNSALVGYDGMRGEGIHYHFVWLTGLTGLSALLEGYEDPEDWTPPAGVKKITEPLTHDTIMPPSDRWNSMITSPMMMTLPDATDSGSHDSYLRFFNPDDSTQAYTWPAGNMVYGYGIEKVANSYLLGAYGQLGLGDGKLGDRNLQVQSLLHFSPRFSANGHAHNDTLMMGLFGRGHNLLSFPGRQKMSQNPENKNMVMINETIQSKFRSDIGGRLELFAPLPGIQISRVDASHIIHHDNKARGEHPTSMDRYRRTLIQNTIDIEKAYLLDIFEAVGGETHDYLIRGSAVLKQEFPETNLAGMEKVNKPLIPKSKAAEFFKTETASYAENKSFSIDFKFSPNDDKNLAYDVTKFGTRSHFPAQGEKGELYLHGMEEQWTKNGGELYQALGKDALIPQYTIHRSGPAPLKSTFVAVHEVLDGSGNSFIKNVIKESIGDNAIAVKVELKNGRVDTYLVSFDGKQDMQYQDLEATAIIAASSSFEGKSDLWIVGGDVVQNAQGSLKPSASEVTGVVSRVNRKEDGATSNSFDTYMMLTPGYALANQTILLENFDGEELKYTNSYTIKYIEEICGQTRIHLNFDPGVEIGATKVRELHHPKREAIDARLKFVSNATTVPYIANVSPGKDPMQRINPQVGRALDTGEGIAFTTIPSGKEITYSFNNIPSEMSAFDNIYINDDQDITMYVENTEGFVKSKIINETYYMPQLATIGEAGASGLMARRYSGVHYKFGNPKNTYKFFDGTQIVDGLSFKQVPFEKGDSHGVIIEGYIKVPTTGLYKFFTRVDRAVQLKIDDKVIVQDSGLRRIAQWVGEIYLEKGLHKIYVENFVKNDEHFSVMWEGPEIPYGEIPESVFFQDIR